MTTLQRLQKELLVLKNQYRQFEKNLVESNSAYFWYQRQIGLKQAEINRHVLDLNRKLNEKI
jgi:hypothetical protein